MLYAKIKDGKVINVLSIRQEQADEFPDCAQIHDGLLIELGDTYSDGKFYRDGVELKSIAQLHAETMEALNILLGGEVE